MKVLVVKPTALGDVAQAVVMAPLLKQWAGCHELVWLVDEDYAPLLRLCPAIDRLILFPRRAWRRNWFRARTLSWFLNLHRERFDIVVDLQGLARSAAMTLATGAPRRLGLKSSREFSSLAYTEVFDDHQTHAAARYRAAIHYLTGQSEQLSSGPCLQVPSLPLPGGLVTGQYTVIHPYSQWGTKLWSWQNYETLIRLLPQETFVLVGQGPFFPVFAPKVLDLRNKTSLEGLLLLLGHARAVISTDSGPLHLAAAFGKPVVAIFGATDPAKTGPQTPVRSIITAPLPCRPCLSKQCRHSQAMACMFMISPQQVAEGWREVVKTS